MATRTFGHRPALERFSAHRLSVPEGVTRGILFVDYDGTLAPIVARPDRARIPAPIRRALSRAVAHPAWTVCVISGRKLDDVRRRVGIPDIVYAGNHGFEIAFPAQPHFVHPAAKNVLPLMGAIRDLVRRETAGLPGILVEDKSYSLSVHTRQAAPGDERKAHMALMHAARVPVRRDEVVIRRGKKVLEVRPAVPWDKGRAVAAIIESIAPPLLTVYFGDDNTDEDAFRWLRGSGITVRVGKGETNARYFIPAVAGMAAALDGVVSLLPGRPRPRPGSSRGSRSPAPRRTGRRAPRRSASA